MFDSQSNVGHLNHIDVDLIFLVPYPFPFAFFYIGERVLSFELISGSVLVFTFPSEEPIRI
jgi:hypothetical protein